MPKVYYFFMSFKFYTDSQPLVNVGSFAFISEDSDFSVTDILQKMTFPDGWKAKELMAFPQEMHPSDFHNFLSRHPDSVFDFREDSDGLLNVEFEIKAARI